LDNCTQYSEFAGNSIIVFFVYHRLIVRFVSCWLYVIWWFFCTGASNFTEAMKMGSEIYHHLKNVIKAKYGQDGNEVLL